MSIPSMALLCLVLLLLALPSVAAPWKVTLNVMEDQGVARTAEPLVAGLPLPKGAVTDPADLRVYDSLGRALPCQVHQLGLSWPDGSLRWVLVQFQATVGARATATYDLCCDPEAIQLLPEQPVELHDTGAEVEVITGPLRLKVSRRDFRLPNSLEVRQDEGSFVPVITKAELRLRADREAMSLEEFHATGRDPKDLDSFGLADTGPLQWGKVQHDLDYSDHLGGPARITVEENGPLRVVLRCERDAEKREGETGFVVRLYAYAGQPYIRVEYTLESYEQFLLVPAEATQRAIVNNKHVRQFRYGLQLTEPATGLRFGTPDGAVEQSPEASPWLRQLTPDRYTLGEVSADGHAPGWLTVESSGHAVTLATKWFWETAPRALGYEAGSGELCLDLRPEVEGDPGYPLAAGRVKTYEFMLGVDTPGPELSAAARTELRAYPDPEYVTATGATHRFVPLTDPGFGSYAEYVANTRRKAAAARLYGDVDFGDQIGWNENERWNGYHGVTHEWFTFYLASGEPELLRIAEQETWHSLDVDTQHWGFQPGCREAEYARQHDHVCPLYYQGGIKVWALGEVDYYLLTGRRRVLESLERTGQFLLNCGGVVNNVFTNERASSLPFLHLAHIYGALGDEAALREAFPEAMAVDAGHFRRDTIGRAASAPYLTALRALSQHFNGVYGRGEHVQSSFLASYPAEAQYEYFKLTGDEAGRAGVLQAARFLYQDMIIPTGIIKYAGGAPWDDNSPWMPWWDGVEAPAALAYMVSGDRQYLDWGKAPVDWVLNYRREGYSSGPWSWQGAMGFGGTLSTYLWAMREAGLSEADLSQQRADLDLDAAVATCQAKCEEFRERAMQNTPESGIFCRLAAEVGRVLINQGKYDEAFAWLEPWAKAPYGVYVNWALERAKRRHEAQ